MKTYVNKEGHKIYATEKAYQVLYKNQGYKENGGAKNDTSRKTKVKDKE